MRAADAGGLGFAMGVMVGLLAYGLGVWLQQERARTLCAEEQNVFRCERVVIYQPVEVSP
jgi:hypothetical protein